MKLTVLIFTHNPNRPTLCRVIESLKGQSLDANQWELIVVDNASDEPISDWLDLAWHANSQIIHEPVTGKTRAVLKGIAAANEDLLVFVDDDNFLEPAYLIKTIEISQRWPMLGAWGGRILPEFEEAPPEWTRRYWSYLTILDCPHDRWSNIPDHFEAVPPGAGLAVRRRIARAYAELIRTDPLRLSLDRTGKALISGGDTDLTFTACDLGYGIARFSSLELRHFMPRWRFEEPYLLRMVEGMSYSLWILAAVRGNANATTSPIRRAWKYFSGWKLSPRERKFWHAQLRGQWRAERLISGTPELRTPRDTRYMAQLAAQRADYQFPSPVPANASPDSTATSNLRTRDSSETNSWS